MTIKRTLNTDQVFYTNMDAIEVDAELPGPSRDLCNEKTKQGFQFLFQLTPRGKCWLKFKANEAALSKYVSCCRCKRRKKTKKTEQKRKPKCRKREESPKPKAKSKGELRRERIREKRAERKRTHNSGKE
uniref:Uncharacterized protein n=1 Tax=Glossina austeni TaxID=7395 RepID=A0A1A9UIM9_GLOAU